MEENFNSSMANNKSQKSVFLVAGEESANQYAKRLIQDGQRHNIHYSGIGYPSLEKLGFEMVFNAKELSVMGGVEVLRKYSTIKKAFNAALENIEQKSPDVVLLIDFGGFNLKLAKEIKKKKPSQKIYYFISPKFWAWRESRVERVKKWVDKMFVIHPFEVDFYKKHNYASVEFSGHPLNQELKPEQFNKELISEQKNKLNLNSSSKTLALLFGSRESEITRLMPVFLEVAESLKLKNPSLNLITIIPPSFSKDEFKKRVESVNDKVPLVYCQSEDPMDVMALADVALVASGTATLQLGLLEKPMAIGYKMNPITMFLAKRFVKGVKHAGLVNILSEKEISKEFLQGDLMVKPVSDYLHSLLNDESVFNKQRKELLGLKNTLGDKNPYKVINDEIFNLN